MLKDVGGIGRKNQIIEVADGFALNSLIPQGKAAQATAAKIAEVEKHNAAEARSPTSARLNSQRRSFRCKGSASRSKRRPTNTDIFSKGYTNRMLPKSYRGLQEWRSTHRRSRV